jgi:hypothetical protein
VAEHTINDLRTHLFDTLKALKDPNHPMDIDRAKAIADVSRTIIESAKVQVAFMEVTGAGDTTGFIPAERQIPASGTAASPQGLEPLRQARRA